MSDRAAIGVVVAVGLLWLHGRRNRSDRGAFERWLHRQIVGAGVAAAEAAPGIARDVRAGAVEVFKTYE